MASHASEILTVTSITSTSITVSINKGTYYGVNLFIRADGSLTSTKIEKITDTSYTFTDVSEMTTYYLNAEYLTSATDTGQGPATVAIEVYVPGSSDSVFTLFQLEAGTNSISFYIEPNPEPDGWTERYSYEVYYKKSFDSDYLCYEFWDDAPNILDEIELVYGIEHSTTYNIYVRIWYNGADAYIVGQTPIYTITTATPSAIPSIEILSISRTSTDFSITIQNTSAFEFEYILYSHNTYLTASSGTQVEYASLKSGETITWEDNFMENDQYRPYFICIFAEYNNGGSAFSYPYSSGSLTIGTKQYGVFKNSSSEDPWSPEYWIKIDVDETAPWDGRYGTSTSPNSSNNKYFMWAPYTGTNSVIAPSEHENIWVSTNYHLHSTTSEMAIKIDLKYKCDISFKYLVYAQYLEYDTDDFLKISFDGEIRNASNTDRENVWKRYTVTNCDIGSHTLILTYSKNATVNFGQDCACFADFTITPVVPDAWDWQISNYNAEDIQTQTAYNLVTNGGLTKEFSYLVWNDMVDKVKHILDYIAGDYLGGTWNTTKFNCSYEDTLMVDTEEGRTLTAKRYNSLRQNVDDLLTNKTGIDEVVSMVTPVSGQVHFINLMTKVNEYIGTL